MSIPACGKTTAVYFERSARLRVSTRTGKKLIRVRLAHLAGDVDERGIGETDAIIGPRNQAVPQNRAGQAVVVPPDALVRCKLTRAGTLVGVRVVAGEEPGRSQGHGVAPVLGGHADD